MQHLDKDVPNFDVYHDDEGKAHVVILCSNLDCGCAIKELQMDETIKVDRPYYCSLCEEARSEPTSK